MSHGRSVRLCLNSLYAMSSLALVCNQQIVRSYVGSAHCLSEPALPHS